ncbi:hypothetical protein HZB88_02365 [archaeon]|nr:hypothetical protein [archaeon]
MLVHPQQIINGTADLYCLLKGITSDFEDMAVKTGGRYKKSVLEGMLANAEEKAGSSRLNGTFEKHIINNALVLEWLEERIKNEGQYYEVIFMSSVSADNSQGIPRRIASDPLQDSFLLSTKMLEIAADSMEAYRNVLFVPVAPVIFPCIVKDGLLQHAFPKQMDSITQYMESKGKQGFGSLYKGLKTKGNIPNYQFSEHMFDFGKARDGRRKYEKPESILEIGYAVHLNLKIMAEAFKLVAEILKLEQIVIFAMGGSYATDIMEQSAGLLNIKPDNIGYPNLSAENKFVDGEANRSAISALQGYIQSKYMNRTKLISKASPRKKQKPTIPIIEFLNCPYKPFILCSSQKDCDRRSETDACSLDHIKSLGQKETEELEQHCREQNIGIYEGIEAIIYRLITEDFEVSEPFSTRRKYSWQEEIRGAVVVPNELDAGREFKGDIRASSFGSKCYISRIIANMRDEIPVERINALARIGTTTHEIMLKQYKGGLFLPNKLLEKVGMPALIRDRYCERFVSFMHGDISITGHLDSSLAVYKPEETCLAVIDIKHAKRIPNIRKGHRYQLLCYSKGVQKELEHSTAYLILVNTPFREGIETNFARFGMFRKQEISIMKVGKDDLLYKKLDYEIEYTNYIIKNINANLLRSLKEDSLKLCMGCLDETRLCCDWLLNKSGVK